MAEARRTISIVEAARVIYHTREPDEKQLRSVYQRMKAGVLPVRDYGNAPLEWTTTEQDLADFLAKQLTRQEQGRLPIQSARQARESRQVRAVYQSMWRDYFLAVLLRRRMRHRSSKFHRAVVVGQVVLFVTLLAVTLSTIRIWTAGPPAEQVAIERWISENTDRHQIVRWHPTTDAPDGRGVMVEVEYRYAKDSPRTIQTRRFFQVENDQAREVEAP